MIASSTTIAMPENRSLLGELVQTFSLWRSRLETRNALEGLSERELDDIGLCRADIEDVIRNLR